MTRKVRWSPGAKRDFLDLVAFIAEDSPEAALRIGPAIAGAAARLGEHSTGRPGRIIGIHEKSVPKLPYVIAYEIMRDGSETIVIHRIIHTARNWPKGDWPGET